MAARDARARPVRTLIVLGVLLVVVFGALAAGVRWSTASWAPNLALDLEGGTQVILTPVTTDGSEITPEAIDQAIAIIRQRVNSSGVSEAEITSQGGQNIVVALPGNPSEETLDLVRESAVMNFRPVLAVSAPQPIQDPGTSPTGAPGLPGVAPTAAPDATVAPDGAPGSDPPAAPVAPGAGTQTPTPDSAGQPGSQPTGVVDNSGAETTAHIVSTTGAGTAREPGTDAQAAAATPAPAPVDAPAAPVPTPAEAPATDQPTPTDPSDMAWLTQMWEEFGALDCTDPASLQGGGARDPDQPIVTCADDGSVKYVLGPVEVHGYEIARASSGLGTAAGGVVTNEWVVNIELNKSGTKAFREVTERLQGLERPRNQFAIVLDGLVVSAPYLKPGVIIADGRSEISGSFTQESAATLANQLNFGSLPITFEVQSQEQISATLGAEQLERGLLAGVIGLALVFIYMLVQYRALGLVTVGSLLLAAVITYGLITLLSWTQGYRLSLPGVTGLIVSIGITADSFIVFFERIRDELRAGRALPSAVDHAWQRARRTIVVADIVSLIAAVVLYFLAVGGVRGFAFTLGLTTIVDLVIVFWFTHPMIVLLARRPFFATGHRGSGLDHRQLGLAARPGRYQGRGRIAPPTSRAVAADVTVPETGPAGGEESGRRLTIAERRARARAAEAAAAADDDPASASATDDDSASAAARVGLPDRTEGGES